MQERQTSQLSTELDCRIQTNLAFGNTDLTAWLLEKLQLRRGERLLDVGCGTGKHLIPFAKAIGSEFACTGVDLSAESLAKAKESAQREGVKINFIQLNMDELHPLDPSQQYDTITAIYSAYYSNNVPQLLLNMTRVLKPGGRIVIMGPYADNNKEWFDFLNQFMTLSQQVAKSSTTFMFDDILPFACSRFEHVKCYRFVNRVVIPSLDDLRNYWKSNIYYDEKLDESFERAAAEHFKHSNTFQFNKVALYAEMINPC